MITACVAGTVCMWISTRHLTVTTIIIRQHTEQYSTEVTIHTDFIYTERQINETEMGGVLHTEIQNLSRTIVLNQLSLIIVVLVTITTCTTQQNHNLSKGITVMAGDVSTIFGLCTQINSGEIWEQGRIETTSHFDNWEGLGVELRHF